MKPMLCRILAMPVLMALLFLNLQPSTVHAQGTAYTYQGRLNSGGTSANGSYDIAFTLFATNTSGVAIAGPVTNSGVNVTSGLFTTTVDFGNAFTGGSNWLEIAVSTNGANSFFTLAPRQQLAPVPYAVYSEIAGGIPGLVVLQTTNSPNLKGGSSANYIPSGVYGATISGGGGTGLTNGITGNFGTVAGGQGNTAGTDATVGGGNGNTAVFDGTVAGGYGNSASGAEGTIGGGAFNSAGVYATVGGGFGNNASGGGSFVGGGGFDGTTNYYGNSAQGGASVVGGGLNNIASGLYSAIGGGDNNAASGPVDVISGGEYNTASHNHTTVAGGDGNNAGGDYGTVGGGQGNNANGAGDVLAGGINNFSGGGNYSSISGGNNNDSSGSYAVIGGGQNNQVSALFAVIGGGVNNSATNDTSVVSGGTNNVSGGYAAIVAGGSDNQALGDYSFAAGNFAAATNNNSFVWSDGSTNTFSTTTNVFIARASGGFVLYSSTGGTGVSLAPGSGSWSTMSDRSAKNAFSPVHPQAILAEVASLPMSTWSYKTEQGVRHIGPMAQDFHTAFKVGEDNKHIADVDEGGVALAAIQGLNEKVEIGKWMAESQMEQLETENSELKGQMTELRSQLESLQKAVAQLAAKSPSSFAMNTQTQ